MPTQRAQLLEEAFGNSLLDALAHRLEDDAELPCVDEPDPPLAGENGEVVAKRMDVEEMAPWRQRSMDLTQDVHDVLRFNSSERPGEEREIELALRQL